MKGCVRMQILVVIVVVAAIAFIAWWFFGKHDQGQSQAQVKGNSQEARITVNGGYSPETVVLKQGVPAKLVFNRLDKSNCLKEVVFKDFGISEELPIKQDKIIEIDTIKAGEYTYACGMDMFHGKVVIK